MDERARDLEPALPSADGASGAEEVLALVERASELWEDSCEDPNDEGLCLEFVLGNQDANRCGRSLLGDVRVRARDSDAANAAQADFAEALSLAQDLEAPEGDDLRRRYKRALATARLAQVDADLEAYFEIETPRDIDFTVEDWKRDSGVPKWEAEHADQLEKKEESVERFKEYFETKARAGKELMVGFASIKQFGDVEVTLQAALRTSWTAVHFHDQITSFEIPVSIRDKEEMRAVYCDVLVDQAEIPRKQGADAAVYCHEHASAAGVEGSTAQACADLATKLGPTANESSQ